jgi:hypothetical protein
MKRRKCSLKEAMKAPPERWMEITFLYSILFIVGYYWVIGEHWALFAFPVAFWLAGVNA